MLAVANLQDTTTVVWTGLSLYLQHTTGINMRSCYTDGAEGYSLPREPEKAREAGYFSSLIYHYHQLLCPMYFVYEKSDEF